MVSLDWVADLAEQLDFWWRFSFRPRLEGLTDEEYFWEPVEGCWSIRRDAADRWALDWAYPAPEPPPVATIAWRLGHIGSPVLGLRASNHFGDGSRTVENLEWPGSAAEGIAFVEDAYAAWSAGVRGLDEEALAAPCGPAEGPFAELPMAGLVLHINRETIHHGAEVGVLRDLWRAGLR